MLPPLPNVKKSSAENSKQTFIYCTKLWCFLDDTAVKHSNLNAKIVLCPTSVKAKRDLKQEGKLFLYLYI